MLNFVMQVSINTINQFYTLGTKPIASSAIIEVVDVITSGSCMVLKKSEIRTDDVIQTLRSDWQCSLGIIYLHSLRGYSKPGNYILLRTFQRFTPSKDLLK